MLHRIGPVVIDETGLTPLLLAGGHLLQNGQVTHARVGGIYHPVGEAIPASISNIVATVLGTTITITWTTNLPSDSCIEWGLTAAYGSAVCSADSGVTSHTVIIDSTDGVVSGETYHFRVASNPGAGYVFSDDQTFLVATAPYGGSVAISGSAVVGQTLTATPSGWLGDPAAMTYTYQWTRCAADGGSCVAISGATASTYEIQAGDAGSTVRVGVVASNGVSPNGAATSNATAVIGATTIGLEGDSGAIQLETGDKLLVESGNAADISEFSAATALTGAEVFVLVQGGATVKATADQLKTYMQG